MKDAEEGKVSQRQQRFDKINGEISYTQLRRRRRSITSSMYKRNHHVQNEHDYPEPNAYHRRQFCSRRPRCRCWQLMQIAPSREDKSKGRRSNPTRHFEHDAQVTGNQCDWIGWIGSEFALHLSSSTPKRESHVLNMDENSRTVVNSTCRCLFHGSCEKKYCSITCTVRSNSHLQPSTTHKLLPHVPLDRRITPAGAW